MALAMRVPYGRTATRHVSPTWASNKVRHHLVVSYMKNGELVLSCMATTSLP